MCLAAVNATPAGTDGIIKKIRETVGDKPVYLSIDVSPAEPHRVAILKRELIRVD